MGGNDGFVNRATATIVSAQRGSRAAPPPWQLLRLNRTRSSLYGLVNETKKRLALVRDMRD